MARFWPSALSTTPWDDGTIQLAKTTNITRKGLFAIVRTPLGRFFKRSPILCPAGSAMSGFRLPNGWHSLTPRIVTDDVAGLVEFLRQVFDATGELHPDRPAIMQIGDSVIMVSSVGPREAMPAFLYLYVEDADATYRRALGAGARSLEEPIDTPYGDRRGMVEDRWGNVWQIANFKNLSAQPAASTEREPAAFDLAPVGYVRSSLMERKQAPKQGSEGAPHAWIDLKSTVADG